MITKNRIAARVKEIAEKRVRSELREDQSMTVGEMHKRLQDPALIISALFEYLEEMETKRVPKIMQVSLSALKDDYLQSLEAKFEEMQTAETIRKANQDMFLAKRYNAQMQVYRSIPWPLRFLVPKPVKSWTMPRRVLRPQPTFEGFVDFIQNAEMTVESGEL